MMFFNRFYRMKLYDQTSAENQPNQPGSPNNQPGESEWRVEVNNELREHLGGFPFFIAI